MKRKWIPCAHCQTHLSDRWFAKSPESPTQVSEFRSEKCRESLGRRTLVCGLMLLAIQVIRLPEAGAIEFRQNVAFSTANQNPWSPGEAFERSWVFDDLQSEFDVPLPTVDFDPVKTALRALDSVLGTGLGDLLGVGVSIGGSVKGKAGVEFGYHVNGGRFHMNYPGRSSLDFATYRDSGAIATGRDSRVTTAFVPGLSAPFDPSRVIGSPISLRGGGGYDLRDLPGTGFETFEMPSFGTEFPYAAAWADLFVSANAGAFMEINAILDKWTVRAPAIGVDERVRLAEVNWSGIYIAGEKQLGVPFGQPIEIPGVGEVTLSYPDVTVTSGPMESRGILRGTSSKPILSLQAQLEKLVPVIGGILTNEIGPFGYTIVETLGGPTLSLYQDIQFTPQPRVELAFSTPVLHRQLNGQLVPTNRINVALGESFDLQPMFGAADVIEVQPTYYLNNTFYNEIGLALGVDFDVDALELRTPVANLGPAFHADLTFSDLIRLKLADFEFQMPLNPVVARHFSLNTVNPTTQFEGARFTLRSAQLVSENPATGRSNYRLTVEDSTQGKIHTLDVTGIQSEFFGAPELDFQLLLETDEDVLVTDAATGSPLANLGRHLCISCNYDYSEYFGTPIDLETPEQTLFINPFFDFPSGLVDVDSDPLLSQNNYFRTSHSSNLGIEPIVYEQLSEPVNVLFSNVAEPERDQSPIGAGAEEYWAGQSFYTGDHAYDLRSIRAMVAETSEGSDVVAQLYRVAEDGQTIGELMTTFSASELSDEVQDAVFLPDEEVLLDANSVYWFVLGTHSGSLVWSYEDTALGMSQNTYGPGSLSLFADSSDAGENWIYYSPLNPYRLQINASIRPWSPGDFGQDGRLDNLDIDQLSGAVREGLHPLDFDLTEDGLVDQNDRDFWVHNLRGTFYGDANLDGEFNSGDLVAVLAIGRYEDPIDGNAGWLEGDWDGDGDFATGDLVLALQDGGYEQGPFVRVEPVPEPASILLLGLSVTTFFFRHTTRVNGSTNRRRGRGRCSQYGLAVQDAAVRHT